MPGNKKISSLLEVSTLPDEAMIPIVTVDDETELLTTKRISFLNLSALITPVGGSFLPLSGGTLTGQLNMSGNKIVALSPGTIGTDAVNKTQLDSKADTTHDHSTLYSALGHSHGTLYAAISHNHDTLYSATTHNHSALYSAIGHEHSTLYYLKTEVNNLVNAKANTVHYHDDRYYTETETNTLLSNKSDTWHTHNYINTMQVDGTLYLNCTTYRYLDGNWQGPGYLFVPLQSYVSWGFTSSTAAKTWINVRGVFGTSIPNNVKALLIRTWARDSGSANADCWFALSPNNVAWSIAAAITLYGQVNDKYIEGQLTVPCDGAGNMYYQIAASGANTLDVSMQVWGYWI